MTILDRYLIKGYSRSFLYSVLTFLVISLIAVLIGRIETFVHYQATFYQICRFFINHVPFIFVQITPFAALLATLFTFGNMSQKNEITALKASGVSLYRISVPILTVSLFLSLSAIFLNEFIVPRTNLKFRRILNYEIRKEKFSPFGTRSNIAYRGEGGSVYYIEHFNGEKDTLEKVTVLRFDRNQELIARIDAKKAVYEDNKWWFNQGVVREFKDKKLVASALFKRQFFPLNETPDNFRKRQKLPEEMTYRELKNAVEKQKSSGGDYKRDQVYLYFTISFPFAAFFMSYLAIPFALFNNRSNPMINFGICLMVAFFYWSCIAISHALGLNGFFPPLLAAWFANILFGVLGSYFYLKAPK